MVVGRRRGDAAAPGGDGGAGRGAAGEQRRREHARRGVPARGRHRAVRADDTDQPVGADGGHGGGAAPDAGAGEGRRRQRRLRVNGGRTVLPTLHRLQLHQKVCEASCFMIFILRSNQLILSKLIVLFENPN